MEINDACVDKYCLEKKKKKEKKEKKKKKKRIKLCRNETRRQKWKSSKQILKIIQNW